MSQLPAPARLRPLLTGRSPPPAEEPPAPQPPASSLLVAALSLGPVSPRGQPATKGAASTLLKPVTDHAGHLAEEGGE